MNDFTVCNEFLRINECVRDAWTDWSTAYIASTDPIAIAAPNRGLVNVPDLYDNYIHTIIANMPVYLRSQITTMIGVTDLDKDRDVDPPEHDLIDLSFNVLLDDKANGINIAGNQLDARGFHAYAQDQRVTQQDLTDNILNEIKGDFSVRLIHWSYAVLLTSLSHLVAQYATHTLDDRSRAASCWAEVCKRWAACS